MMGLFLIGLVFGSFLNVLIWRLDDEKAPKFWQGRSLCPKCKHSLAWYDNIPLVSYLLLGGKCRHCKKKISLQYPIVELTTAVSTVIVGLLTLNNFSFFEFLGILIITYAFIVIFFADWIYGLIPDEMEIVIVILTALLIVSTTETSLIATKMGQNFLVGVVSLLAFFLVVVATKFRGMGLGDVKLAFVIGFLLGWRGALVSFWMCFILGGLFAISLLVLKRRKFRDTIALGPFMVIGTLIAVLWENQILRLIGL